MQKCKVLDKNCSVSSFNNETDNRTIISFVKQCISLHKNIGNKIIYNIKNEK